MRIENKDLGLGFWNWIEDFIEDWDWAVGLAIKIGDGEFGIVDRDCRF